MAISRKPSRHGPHNGPFCSAVVPGSGRKPSEHNEADLAGCVLRGADRLSLLRVMGWWVGLGSEPARRGFGYSAWGGVVRVESGDSVVVAFGEPAEFFIGMRSRAPCPRAGTLTGVVMRTDQHV